MNPFLTQSSIILLLVRITIFLVTHILIKLGYTRVSFVSRAKRSFKLLGTQLSNNFNKETTVTWLIITIWNHKKFIAILLLDYETSYISFEKYKNNPETLNDRNLEYAYNNAISPDLAPNTQN